MIVCQLLNFQQPLPSELLVLGLHQRPGNDRPTASLHDKASLRRPNTAQNQSINVIMKVTLSVMEMDTQKAYHEIQFSEVKLICDRSLSIFCT